MRNALLAYLRDLDSANIAVKKAYDRHIAAAVKAKDDSTVATLRRRCWRRRPEAYGYLDLHGGEKLVDLEAVFRRHAGFPRQAGGDG